jgi:hypothetical protein
MGKAAVSAAWGKGAVLADPGLGGCNGLAGVMAIAIDIRG